MVERILVTGGSGFIGSALCRHLISATNAEIVNLDKLTYAASPAACAGISVSPRYRLVVGDIADTGLLDGLFRDFRPQWIFNLAAESHVDRSIDAPDDFVATNVVGTLRLLEAAKSSWRDTPSAQRHACRFIQVSTDEVFGSLGDDGYFNEASSVRPNSPYAASKAGADHLAHAWHATFDLPTIVTRCSNNYGPYQFPEKLIPRTIARALRGEQIDIYGDGCQVRDWLFVEDHAAALTLIAAKAAPGTSFTIGGGGERRNIDLVRTICQHLDRLAPNDAGNHADLIRYVADRPGHDYRYAIDDRHLRGSLGWAPRHNFETGLAQTVAWYLNNRGWWETLLATRYDGGRLGLADQLLTSGEAA